MTPASGRPRLLVVGPVPPPIGGVETCVQAVLESPALDVFDVAHCDITKRRPKATQGAFDGGNLVWAARHLARMARSMATHRPDVVYVPISGTTTGVLRDLALAALARRGNVRVVGHQHDGGIADVLGRGGPIGAAVRAGFGRFHRLLVLGESWRQMFLDWGLTAPVELCPSTFRRELFEAASVARTAPAAGAPLRALFVGQVGERKGVPDLVRTMKVLADRRVDATLTLVGPDEQPGRTDAALALARSLGVADRVRFTGALMGEALHAEYRAHDVFVLPSHLEGLPVVLFEAGAFSLPAITTRVGSIPDLVRHDVNGLFVTPGHADEIAGALEVLARDLARRARLGAQLRTDILAYHPERVGARVADALWDELRIAGRVSGERPRDGDAGAASTPRDGA